MGEQRFIVTGGAGFIGANLVHLLLAERPDAQLTVVDKLTYAGNLRSLESVANDPRFHFIRADIADRAATAEAFRDHHPTSVVNFAAESHVDRSIDGPAAFIETNIVGTFELLEASRQFLSQASEAERNAFRFLHISTDEVYGSLGATGEFEETTPYEPNSVYSASKASADRLVRAYQETFGVPCLVTNCSNNYGPSQFPEKLIPLMIANALEGKPLPIYGDGGNIRDWLYVEDHCQGILAVLERGQPGESYNIGGNAERTNLEIIDTLCAEIERLQPAAKNSALMRQGIDDYRALKSFVEDRPGHDRRYAIDASKARRELGWSPQYELASGLAETVAWYLDHQPWWEAILSGSYKLERLGQPG